MDGLVDQDEGEESGCSIRWAPRVCKSSLKPRGVRRLSPFISEETEAPGGGKGTRLYHSVGDSEQAGVRRGSFYHGLCPPPWPAGGTATQRKWLDWQHFSRARGPPV